jgi:hypothetical protein
MISIQSSIFVFVQYCGRFVAHKDERFDIRNNLLSFAMKLNVII